MSAASCEHHLEAVAGIGGIERHVGRPALDDADEAGDERHGTIDAQTDPVSRPYTMSHEIRCDPIGQLVELAVGEALVGVLHRRRVRIEPCPPLQPLRHGREAVRWVEVVW